MKLSKSLLLGLLVISMAPLSAVQAGDTGMKTVSYVDVGRYLGTWYQIARKPLFFEGDCACARQILAPLADGTVSVYNSCNEKTPSGPLQVIRGTATDEDTTTNAKFLIDFNLPNKGQYWVIGLAADYSYAVVSDPTAKSLYIVSKTPTLPEASFNEAVAIAKQQVDVSDLVVTNQQGCTYPQ